MEEAKEIIITLMEIDLGIMLICLWLIIILIIIKDNKGK